MISVIITGLLLSACTSDTNPVISPADPAATGMAGSLAKGMAANKVMDFEDLLDHRDLKKIVDISKKYSFQRANEIYDLYPGVVFSEGLKLGYISKPDPKRPGGQLYLYTVGKPECSVTFDQPVYFTSVSARVVAYSMNVNLIVTGIHGKGTEPSEYTGVVNKILTDHPLNFEQKVTMATFRLKGKAETLVLDNFVFGHKPNANARVTNTKMGFEELLENEEVYKYAVDGRERAFQKLNDKFDLYPGIEFSPNLMLGYDAKANPGLGGQVYLYCKVGANAYIRFLDQTVYFKSVYARIHDPKYKEPIVMRLRGYGEDKQRWTAEVTFVDGDLAKDLPKFDGEVNQIFFSTKGSAKEFVLDDFKFKE